MRASAFIFDMDAALLATRHVIAHARDFNELMNMNFLEKLDA